ncbi:MAG: metal ABC transporter permease [Spirochaetes bacterium]|nr:metal ABC transporter permease [Spirochaetota bacterium]
MNLLSILSYPSILLGGIILFVSGLVFPLPGIFILRLHLIPLRFVMMHGALLGGALALWMGTNPLPLALGVNFLLVGILILWGGLMGQNSSSPLEGSKVTTFLMVSTVALAFLVIYKANVPAKDTLALLWGSIYALDSLDVWSFLGIVGCNTFYLLGWHREILAVLYDREIAQTSGVRTSFHGAIIVLLAGFTVSLSMRFLGALLVDAVVLLPALIGLSLGRSVRSSFRIASLSGGVAALLGYLVGILVDIPVSSSVTLCTVVLFGLSFGFRKIRAIRRNSE